MTIILKIYILRTRTLEVNKSLIQYKDNTYKINCKLQPFKQ